MGGEGGDSDVPHISGWSWYLLRWRSLGKAGSGLEGKTRWDLLSGMNCEGQIRERQQVQGGEPSSRLMTRGSRAVAMGMVGKPTSLLNKPTNGRAFCFPKRSVSVCQVAEQADQREAFLWENVEVKLPYGEEGRPVMWKIGSRETRKRLRQRDTFRSLLYAMEGGAQDMQYLCRDKAVPKQMAGQPHPCPWLTKGFTGEKEGEPSCEVQDGTLREATGRAGRGCTAETSSLLLGLVVLQHCLFRP